MNQNNLTQRQQRIQEYLHETHVQEILADLLNALAYSFDPKPVIFMIKYLATLCTKEDLSKNGISILGQLPKANLAIVYPQFQSPNSNLFKQYFTKNIFDDIKNQRTAKNVTLRNILYVGLENESHPIGIFAPDEDSYSKFAKIFDPILESLNKNLTLNELSHRESTHSNILKIKDAALNAEENKFISNLSIKVRRNLSNHAFNCYMQTSERQKVKEKIQTALFNFGNLYLQSEFWDDLNSQTIKFIKEDLNLTNFSPQRPPGLRYKEWPTDRMVYLDNTNNYVIFINKDDHFEYNLRKNTDIDFSKECLDTFELLKKLEQSLNFSYKQRYGYLSTNPKYTGLGLRIRIHLQIPDDKQTLFQMNLAKMNFDFPFLSVEQVFDHHGSWIIKNTQNLGSFTESDVINAIQKTISFLLTDIATNPNQIEALYVQQELRTAGTPLSEDKREESKEPERIEERKSGEQDFSFEQFWKTNIHYPTIHTDNFGILKGAYLVVRRNVEEFPIKSVMSQENNNTLVSIIRDFVHTLPANFKGDFIQSSQEDYQAIAREVIEQYELFYYHGKTQDKNEEPETKWPSGTAIFKSHNKRLIILANLEDHFTLIYNFNSDLITNAFEDISYIVKSLDKKSSGFVFDNETGYTTIDPHHNGIGVELAYLLNLQASTFEIPQDLEVSKKAGSDQICFRINQPQPSKIANLLDVILKLLQEEKNQLYKSQYKITLESKYSESLIKQLEKISQEKGYSVLDSFNQSFEISPSDTLDYITFMEPYQGYLTKKQTEIDQNPNRPTPTAGKLPFIDLADLVPTSLETAFVKLEVGRNLCKYPLSGKISNHEREELVELVHDIFHVFSIEGDIIDIDSESLSNLKSIHYEDFLDKSSSTNKVFLASNNKFACWINCMDHLRLVTQISIHELPAAIHLFERVFEKVEENGFKLLYDMKFKYIAQKLDFSGDNLSLSLQLPISQEEDKEIFDLVQNYFENNKRWRIQDGGQRVISNQPVSGQALMDDIISLFKAVKNKEIELETPTDEEVLLKAKASEGNNEIEESKQENIEIPHSKDETDLFHEDPSTYRDNHLQNTTFATKLDNQILEKEEGEEESKEQNESLFDKQILTTGPEENKNDQSEVLDLNRIDVPISIQDLPAARLNQESGMIFEDSISPEKLKINNSSPTNEKKTALIESPSNKSPEQTIKRHSVVPEENKEEGGQVLSLSKSADFATLEYDQQQQNGQQTPQRNSRIGQMFQKYMSDNGKSPIASAKRNNTISFSNKPEQENILPTENENKEKPAPEPLSKEHRSQSAGVFSYSQPMDGKEKPEDEK